jgi:N-acetylglucosamine-6-phosphate deacetylase
MPETSITEGNIVNSTSNENRRVLIRNGYVASVTDSGTSESTITCRGLVLFPGFIDVHNHGAVGHDVNVATAEELYEVAAFLARKGMTAWVPTLVPDSEENYERIIGEIDRLMELQEGKAVAQAVGVHYEGIFANEAMCGALRPQFFKSGRRLAVGGWQLPRLKRGVHMTTLAPEVEGGIELIKKLVDDGWIVSIGHTRADPKTLEVAFEAGARHMTHFFNAMTGIHHRDVGVAGWGLAKGDVSFDINADGIHVSPSMLKLACEAKGIDRVSLISDSVAPTGLGDGKFDLWGEKISVVNGRTQNERGGIAGSVITMHDAVKQMLRLGFSEGDVAKMASTNPATLLGLNGEIGSIEVGKRADIVALDGDGNIEFVMVGGNHVI